MQGGRGNGWLRGIPLVGRLGLGKVRHLSVADLWIQQAARSGRITYSKIPGQINPADIFTKAVEREIMERHSQFIAGRAETAPKRRDIEKKDQQADGQKRSEEPKA